MNFTNMPVVDTDVANVSRRNFLKGALLGGAGAVTLSPMAFAKALLAGKTPEEVRGWGVGPGQVRIGANENPLGPSPRAIEAVAQNLYTVNRYGFRSIGLIVPLARQYKMTGFLNALRDSQGDPFAAMQQSTILLATGSTQILQALGVAYLSQGGQIVESESSYGQVSATGQMFKMSGAPVEVKRVPIGPNYRIDLDAMRKAIDPNKTKLVVITNPNNPTGTLLDATELRRFIESVPENVVVHIDEAYFDFIRDLNYPSAIETAIQRENVVVTRTFSKIYGLAGMRIGYAAGSPGLINKLMLYTGFPDLNLSTLSIRAAVAALDDHHHVERSRQNAIESEAYVTAEVEKMGFEAIPSEANFMLINLGRETKGLVDALEAKNVYVRYPGYSGFFGDWGLPTCIRVSAGTMEENEAFIETLKEVVKTSL